MADPAPELAVVGVPEPPAVVTARDEPRAEPSPPAEPPKTPDTPPVVAQEAKPVEAKPTVAETPSLIESAQAPGDGPNNEPPKEPAKEEPKPVEVAKDEPAGKPAEQVAEGQKPADGSDTPPAPQEPVAPPSVEYKYTLPEYLTMDDAQRGEFHGMLDAWRADPSNLQPLIDFHVNALQQYDAMVGQRQQDVFNDTRRAWNQEILGDPELGGAGHETAKAAVARMRDKLISDHAPGTKEHDADVAAFQMFSRVTGAGDHPVFWRLLHRAARFLDEPQAQDAQLTEINPSPQKAPRGNGRSLLYDNPTSPNNRRG